MNKFTNSSFCSALFCTAILSLACTGVYASDYVHAKSSGMFTDRQHTRTHHEAVRSLGSKCRRNGVVWSGGVASRFSDRISPRPVRSRWDRAGDSSIRCAGVDAFKQHRVSDQPMFQ